MLERYNSSTSSSSPNNECPPQRTVMEAAIHLHVYSKNNDNDEDEDIDAIVEEWKTRKLMTKL